MESGVRNRTRKFKKRNYSLKTNNIILSPGIRGGDGNEEIRCKKEGSEESGICNSKIVISDFDHPDKLEKYLNEEVNVAKFIYGIGVILKYKETTMKSSIATLERELTKLNEEYVKNEKNYQDLMEDSQGGSASDMKDKLQEAVREQLNKAYETKFSELLIKKQAYDVVLKGIENRRWYIVQQLQENGGNAIVKKINEAALDIYMFYRGPKYKNIRIQLYELVKTISTNPALFRESFALNTSIVGPAGSGKTTMARKIAKWYAVLGILTYDAFYEDPKYKLSISEVSRPNLIGEYVGQTAPKTLGVLAKSLEKTLFIDEAYSVSGCSFDPDGKVQSDSFGEEFIATLLLFMNDHKGYSSIIVAGYENQMENCFFARNEGLPRRFPNKITLPFYATDELFGMFLTGPNGINKKMLTAMDSDLEYQEAEIKKAKNVDLEKLKTQLLKSKYNRSVSSYYKFRYLTVMKPSFLMIHNDTTYDAVEILRKYLISIQLRIWLTNYQRLPKTTINNLVAGKNKESAEENSSISLDNIYSYTILAQILINLFESDTKSGRKHLFRRLFYRDVFDFENQNLSFFPAQSGEMENLVDSCIMTVGSKITDDIKQQVVIGICDEEKVLNSYLVNKKLQIELYKEGDFFVPDENIAEAQVRSESPVSSINSDSINTENPNVPSTPSSPIINKKKYFLELNTYNASIKNIHKRIFDFFELDKLFGKCIPSLKDLYRMLFSSELENLTKYMMNLYLKKVSSDYLQELSSLPDTEFPIHILRKHLEQEISDLKYVNEYKPIQKLFDEPIKELRLESLKGLELTVKEFEDNPDFKKLVDNATNQRSKLLNDIYCYNKNAIHGRVSNLHDPKLKDFENNQQNLIKKGDILYEDFGFSLDVDNSNINTTQFSQKTADFGLKFIHEMEPRLFSRTETYNGAEISSKIINTIKQTNKDNALKELEMMENNESISEIECKPFAVKNKMGNTLEQYKKELKHKLEVARLTPLNIDEIQRLKQKAAIKSLAKIDLRKT